jgi:hypothetical protein
MLVAQPPPETYAPSPAALNETLGQAFRECAAAGVAKRLGLSPEALLSRDITAEERQPLPPRVPHTGEGTRRRAVA